MSQPLDMVPLRLAELVVQIGDGLGWSVTYEYQVGRTSVMFLFRSSRGFQMFLLPIKGMRNGLAEFTPAELAQGVIDVVDQEYEKKSRL